VVVAGELVDIIRRDLREIVDFEIKRFLEHYDDCEVVDVLHICWHSFDGSYDMIIHGLPCYVNTYSTRLGKMYEIDCSIEYHLDHRLIDKLLGWVRVVWVGDRCYVLFDVMDKNIGDVAREIVEKAGVEG
jgi:hypothetical protein